MPWKLIDSTEEGAGNQWRGAARDTGGDADGVG